MTQPDTDWDAAYRQAAPPPWSIGRPQPELERLIDEGKFRSDVLDSGCGHAALSLRLAALGHTVVGLDASATAIAEATAAAAAQGLTTATFARADVPARVNPIAGSLAGAGVLPAGVGFGGCWPGESGVWLLMLPSLPHPAQNETDSRNGSARAGGWGSGS